MITSLRLVNWRSHADTILEFRKGTNLLMGIMGSGKSSVVGGICFGLFGTFPELERRKIKLENVFRLTENELRVVVEFTAENDVYRVERVATKEKNRIESDATAYKNGALVEKGSVAVTTYVESVLKIDYDLFTRAIYSEQNNIDYFLTLDPRRRKEEMDALLGLDKFETARSTAVSTINRIKGERALLEEKFNRQDAEKALKTLVGIKKEVEEIGVKIKVQDAELAKGLQTLQKQRAQFEELRKKRDAYERASKEHLILSNTIETLTRELEKNPFDKTQLELLKVKRAELQNKKAGILGDIKQYQDECIALGKTVATLEERIHQNERRLAEIGKNNAEIQAITGGCTLGEAILECTRIIKENDEALLAKTEQKNMLEASLNEYEKVDHSMITGERCPLCGSGVDAHKIEEIRNAHRKKIDAAKKEIAALVGGIAAMRTSQGEQNLRLKRLETLQTRTQLLEKNNEPLEPLHARKVEENTRLNETKKKKEEIEAANETITRELQALVLKISEYEALARKTEELAKAQKGIEAVRKQLTDMAFSEAEYEKIRGGIQDAELSYQRLNLEKNTLEKEYAARTELKALLEKATAENRTREHDIRRLHTLEEELVMYKNSLLETQMSLRTQLAGAINAAMNEIWHIFYPYGDYTALRLMISEKDYSFEICNGQWKTLESVASGGERACAALTLRVALAMVLTPNVSMLILDEPTHNLDKDAVELLSQTLQFKVPEVVEETVVITHEEALMGSEFAKSYRLTREKEAHGPTRAEEI